MRHQATRDGCFNLQAFKFDPERALQRRLSQGARPAETAFPDEFVSPIVKAGTAAAEKNLQLQELVSTGRGSAWSSDAQFQLRRRTRMIVHNCDTVS